MIWLLLAAEEEVTPVSTVGKIVGGILALVTLYASGYLLGWFRKHGPQDNVLAENTPWRRPVAFSLALLAVVFFVGLWIDPRVTPRLFVVYWIVTTLLFAFVLLVAGIDLLVIRRRAFLARRRLVETEGNQIRKELNQMRPRNPERNGKNHP